MFSLKGIAQSPLVGSLLAKDMHHLSPCIGKTSELEKTCDYQPTSFSPEYSTPFLRLIQKFQSCIPVKDFRFQLTEFIMTRINLRHLDKGISPQNCLLI